MEKQYTVRIRLLVNVSRLAPENHAMFLDMIREYIKMNEIKYKDSDDPTNDGKKFDMERYSPALQKWFEQHQHPCIKVMKELVLTGPHDKYMTMFDIEPTEKSHCHFYLDYRLEGAPRATLRKLAEKEFSTLRPIFDSGHVEEHVLPTPEEDDGTGMIWDPTGYTYDPDTGQGWFLDSTYTVVYEGEDQDE